MESLPAMATRGRPLITAHNIKSVVDLLAFFNAVCPTDQTPHNNRTTAAAHGMVNGMVARSAKETIGLPAQIEPEDASLTNCTNEDYIERLVERDFLVALS